MESQIFKLILAEKETTFDNSIFCLGWVSDAPLTDKVMIGLHFPCKLTF